MNIGATRRTFKNNPSQATRSDELHEVLALGLEREMGRLWKHLGGQSITAWWLIGSQGTI